MSHDLQHKGVTKPRQLLTRLLDAPELLRAVRHLPAASLLKVIDSVGLEDAGELVALASTEQLAELFDQDLWNVEPGQLEERFDTARLSIWLQVLAEGGSDAVARRLTELPFDFVVLLVQRLALVIDIEALALEMSEAGEDADELDKALDSCLYEEWEEFRLIARDASAWDDLLHALLSLDREQHELLRRILERCVALSADWIDDNGGLQEVLNSEEVLEQDELAARDDRRAEKGFVSFADARAFLELARTETATAKRDPITASHFRQLERTHHVANAPTSKTDVETTEHVARLLQLIDTHPAMANVAQLGASARASDVTDVALIETALRDLSELDPTAHAARLDELGYLANVLLSAAARLPTPLRAVEALEAALAVTQRGLVALLETEQAGPTASKAAALLRTHACDRMFRQAWHALDTKGAPNAVLSRLRQSR